MVEFVGDQEEALGKAFDLRQLRRLWTFARPYKWLFVLAFLGLFATFGLELLTPYILRVTLDGPVREMLGGNSVATSTILWLGGAYLAVAAVRLGHRRSSSTCARGSSPTSCASPPRSSSGRPRGDS
jgi:ABC-type multidrug transport system fused ATPase/permease subunit